MRSILLIFLTLVVIAGGFFAYLWFQPSPTPQGYAGPTSEPVVLVPASRPAQVPDPNLMGGGGTSTDVYIKTIDEKTGQLSNEFRATRFEPQKDGTVDVTAPEAKFYLSKSDNGQVLVIRGRTGKVVVPDSTAKHTQLKGGGNSAPTRGQLQDVTVLVYDRPDSPEPTLTCTMNNASFDQETFRIQTESYEHNGKIIPADQVDVQVRGKDYDFDGRGLDIRWNERDRRLQTLEVAHGEELTMKHPQAMRSMTGGATTAPSALAPRTKDLLPLMLASADPAAAGQVIPTPSPTPMPAVKKKKKPTSAPTVAPVKIVRDKTAPIFRATFMDNVKIVQTDQTLATANQMNVDFVMESSKASTQPTTDTSTPAAGALTPAPAAKSESTEPKSLAAASRNAKNKPAPAPAPAAAPVAAAEKKRSKRGGDSTVAGATTSPTTQPEEAPITIYWTGKLRVTPLDAETQDPPTRQDEIVTLEGEPVTLHHGEGEVQCALVHYHTQDSSLRMESSKLTPMIVLNDGAGSTLRTPALDYSGAEGIAVFTGASKADLIVRNESTTQPSSTALASTTAPTTQPQTMVVSWTRTCRVFVTGDPQSGRQNMSIDRAEIDGDVEIHHPQIRGRSDTLDLAFEKVPTTRPVSPDATGPATEMALHDLDAEGKVHYVMMNEQKEQTIDCSHLMLETAKDKAGKTYPSAMNADGKVHAFDDTQDMKCEELAVKFQPTTKPSTQPALPANPQKFDTASIELQSLLARQNVRLSTKDGNSADADQLEMQTKDGVREVTLFGHPFARVVQKDSSLSGPIIKFDPDTNKAYVVGAGTMHAVQVAQDTKDKNAKPQPIDMNWGGNLSADGDLNIIDITEKVAISAKSSDGALNSANSDRLRVTLMDDPKAATRPTFPTTQKVKKPSPMASNGLGDTNFFKDKVVKVVEMQDNAQIQSVLNDANGKLLRRLFMQAPLVRYFMQDKIFVVPSPGQMLMQDVSNSGKTNPELGGDATPNDMSGATVFTWQQELRYDETQHRMTMKGDVYIKHESSGDSKPFTLKCKQLTADLEPAPADATTQPSTAPATTAQATPAPTSAAPTTTALATTAPATTPADAAANQKMRLKHVTASDQVEFISMPIHFESTTIDYDPNTHMLVARGTDRVRAQLYDEKGEVSGSFMELYYNTQSGQVDHTVGVRATIRK